MQIDGEADDRLEHVRRRPRRRPVRRRERRVARSPRARARRRRRRARARREAAREDDRPDRVARPRRQATSTSATRVHLADVEPDDRCDAADADQQAEPAAAAEPFALAGQRHDQRADERHRRDQQPGQRARQLRLGAREQHPGDRDLDGRVREERRPAARAAGAARRGTRANGASSSAPIAVRPKTSVTGASSRTATRIIRYGTPQITHIAAKSSAPRRLIQPGWARSASGRHRALQRRRSRHRSRCTTGRSRRSGRAAPRAGSR